MICTAADEQDALAVAGQELAASGVHCALPPRDAVRACLDAERLRAVLRDSGLPVPPDSLADLADARVRPFTADVLISLQEEVAGIVTHWRAESADGMSARRETFEDHQIRDTCSSALKVLRLTGPASVLGAVTAAHDTVLLEVHPYFSAGLPLSLQAGADLVGQHLRQIFGLPVLAERLVPRPGVMMTRVLHETFQE